MMIMKPVSVGVVPYFLDGRHPGRWSPAAGWLLGLEGAVTRDDLTAVLSGCDPRTGEFLPGFRPARRRAGWDLTFCSPKSLSLLAATSDTEGTVKKAHVGAVEAVMQDLSARAAGRGLFAASFDHASNAAGEPHLHTHVLVANLSVEGARWSAIRGPGWYVDRKAIGALYHLTLREQLERAGWTLDWRLRPDGLADLADVPRSAVRAASTQSRLSSALGRYRARAVAESQPWRGKLTTEGLLPIANAGGSVRASLDEPALSRSIATRLAVRRSDFRQADVIVALAATYPGGAMPPEAREWVSRFCETCVEVPSPTAGRRWTTHMARAADAELVRALSKDRPVEAALVPSGKEKELLRLQTPSAWREVEQILGSDRPVILLEACPGTSALLAQSEALHACSQVWHEAGMRVAVLSADTESQARWGALSGIPAYRAEDHVDVVVVDRADRRTTAELLGLAERAALSGGRLVLVEGGTLPRLTNPASQGLGAAGDHLERVGFGPHVPWQATPAGDDPAIAGRRAAARTIGAWLEAGDKRAVMVGLGIEEVRGLNEAVRQLGDGGPSITNQWGTISAGQRVVVLRSGESRPLYGTFGTVEEVDAGNREARILWEGNDRASRYESKGLAGVGPGHAVTAHLAAAAARPAVVFGPAEAARGLDRSLVIWSTTPVLQRGGRALEAGI